VKSTETSFSTKPDHPTPTTSNNSSLNTSGVNQTGLIANSPTPPVIGNSNVIVVGPDGRIDLISPDKRVRISVRAKPLPLEVTHFLEESASLIKLLTKYTQTKTPLTSSASFAETVKILKKFKVDLEAKLKEASENDEFYSTKEWKTAIDRIISFGPNRFGPNVLVNLEDELKITNVWSVLEATSADSTTTTKTNEYENNIVFGFNLATAKGPLCEEPMQGVAFFMDYFQVTTAEDTTADLESNMANLAIDSAGGEGVVAEKKITSKSVSVNFISLMKDTCRRAFEAQPQRLMAAMYKCEVMTVSSEALGKLYAVLGKR
jgi:ribosome assembly protein 1